LPSSPLVPPLEKADAIDSMIGDRKWDLQDICADPVTSPSDSVKNGTLIEHSMDSEDLKQPSKNELEAASQQWTEMPPASPFHDISPSAHNTAIDLEMISPSFPSFPSFPMEEEATRQCPSHASSPAIGNPVSAEQPGLQATESDLSVPVSDRSVQLPSSRRPVSLRVLEFDMCFLLSKSASQVNIIDPSHRKEQDQQPVGKCDIGDDHSVYLVEDSKRNDPKGKSSNLDDNGIGLESKRKVLVEKKKAENDGESEESKYQANHHSYRYASDTNSDMDVESLHNKKHISYNAEEQYSSEKQSPAENNSENAEDSEDTSDEAFAERHFYRELLERKRLLLPSVLKKLPQRAEDLPVEFFLRCLEIKDVGKMDIGTATFPKTSMSFQRTPKKHSMMDEERLRKRFMKVKVRYLHAPKSSQLVGFLGVPFVPFKSHFILFLLKCQQHGSNKSHVLLPEQ